MGRQDAVLDGIRRIYDAVLMPDGDAAALAAIAALTRAEQSILLIQESAAEPAAFVSSFGIRRAARRVSQGHGNRPATPDHGHSRRRLAASKRR
jgi:hypothetical protein